MFCSNCGHKLNEGEAFCPNCGQKKEDSPNLGSSNQSTVNGSGVVNSKAGTTNTMAILSLVFSVLGLLIAGLPLGIISVCFGATALNHLKSFPEEKGKGLAIAGIAIGAFDIIAVVIQLLVLA